MECDIHGWIEFDFFEGREGNLAWYPALDIRMVMQRNYFIFAKLFGVRNTDYGFQPIFDKRGYPKMEFPDKSTWREIDRKQWKDDGHSHTHVYYNELEEVGALKPSFYKYKGTDYFSKEWKCVIDIMKALSKRSGGSKNVRLVVWFDN